LLLKKKSTWDLLIIGSVLEYKGFLKGRHIGECTRLTYDLIDKLEEDDIPGLLLLIDFEKAFDTVEWSFIEKTLQFYGFGPSLQKCQN
jgi:hypothetical protein